MSHWFDYKKAYAKIPKTYPCKTCGVKLAKKQQSVWCACGSYCVECFKAYCLVDPLRRGHYVGHCRKIVLP